MALLNHSRGVSALSATNEYSNTSIGMTSEEVPSIITYSNVDITKIGNNKSTEPAEESNERDEIFTIMSLAEDEQSRILPKSPY